ncbi:MAG: DegT/DnrJ/EryC1/StrS family aminotransferase [Acidobacteria bacterium]|nr:DegT/DnrJ/EryC1/StrS family aminotransferase [Acidobacteriota bacterium]
MNEAIPLSSPDVTAEDRECVLEVLSGRALSLGPRLPLFEQAVARAAGTRFAVAVNSGTSALHLCVKAADLGPGDEAITTPFSFVASANCLLYERVAPRFVDIDIETYNIDVSRIEESVDERTRAILPVHVFGRPCEMDLIGRLARRYNLAVIEDACEAIGATYRGRPAGSLGDTGVFAFYPNKQVTTGEGGAIVTDDETVARLCRSWRNQGRGEDGDWLQHERLGYNYRLSDINCALGIGQLARLSDTLAVRRAVAERYGEMLAGIPDVVPPPASTTACGTSWFVYVIRLEDEFSRADRDEILSRLRRRGIGCSNYFTPIHLQPFYRERFGYRPGDFPVTEHVAERTIALPFFNRLSCAQAEAVTRALADAIANVGRRSRVFAAAAG